MLVFMKGAVERVLERCTVVGLNPGTQAELDDTRMSEITNHMDKVSLDPTHVFLSIPIGGTG